MRNYQLHPGGVIYALIRDERYRVTRERIGWTVRRER